MWRKVIKNVLLGVFKGLIYYGVFWVLIPWLISSVLKVPFEQPLHLAILILGVFISLGVVSSSVKQFIGIIFGVLSSLLALYIMVGVLGVVINTSVRYDGVIVEASLDYTPLMILIIGVTLIYTIVECFERLVELEE
ncbi:MAG: hypothetical protein LM567_02550 [Desulfurococcaceae archaeon]|nr:hypothetical protein [Desulfurococcaceae archaeon]